MVHCFVEHTVPGRALSVVKRVSAALAITTGLLAGAPALADGVSSRAFTGRQPIKLAFNINRQSLAFAAVRVKPGKWERDKAACTGNDRLVWEGDPTVPDSKLQAVTTDVMVKWANRGDELLVAWKGVAYRGLRPADRTGRRLILQFKLDRNGEVELKGARFGPKGPFLALGIPPSGEELADSYPLRIGIAEGGKYACYNAPADSDWIDDSEDPTEKPSDLEVTHPGFKHCPVWIGGRWFYWHC